MSHSMTHAKLDNLYTDDIRASLDSRMAQLVTTIREQLAESDDTGVRTQANPHEFTDDDSIASLYGEMKITHLSNELDELRDVVAAKKRLVEGAYGVCIDCGANITGDRLKAYPTAKRCIQCQKAREAGRQYPKM